MTFRFVLCGTHTGTFSDIDASGQQIAAEGIDVARVADGRMTDHYEP